MGEEVVGLVVSPTLFGGKCFLYSNLLDCHVLTHQNALMSFTVYVFTTVQRVSYISLRLL
jgi:hypothetical protein